MAQTQLMDSVDAVVERLADSEASEDLKDGIKSMAQEAITELKRDLQGDIRKVILLLLGFDKCFGRNWSVDHCNGRSGNSLIGTELHTVLRPIAVEIVQELLVSHGTIQQLQDELLVELDDEYGHRLRDEYKSRLKTEVRSKLFDYVRKQAEADARVIIPKLIEATLSGKELEDVRIDILTGVLKEGITRL